MEEDKAEITPAYTSVYVVDKDFRGNAESTHAQHMLGFRFSSRISEVTEFQAGYARLMSSEGGVGVNVFGLGWKRSLAKDRLAFVLPFGVALGGGATGVLVATHPSLVATIPIGNQFDLNPSVIGIIPFNRGYSKAVAFTLGGLIRTPGDRWDIRPEVGLLKYPGENETFWSAGVGVALKLRAD